MSDFDEFGFRDDLDETVAEAWARLEAGARDRRAPFHTVQLASLDASGAPRVRTVVLRGADRRAARLRVHTDRRSGKVAGLARDPRAELHAYDSAARIQLRAAGRVSVHRDDEVADAAWTGARPASRVCYRGTAPGLPLSAPGLADPDAAAREPLDPESGRENFLALVLAVERLEWLHLGAKGHRRAEFVLSDGRWGARWLAP